ncbi:hypothetical protein BH11PAT2_BH11PAT2_07230 [soil metagenome]
MYTETIHNEVIPHYHGDIVRILLLTSVGLAFLAIPLWGHIMPFGTMFEVVSGLIVIVLAGLTNPHSQWIMGLNAIAAGIGAFLSELSAISLSHSDSVQLLIMREISALVLIVALYYSVKTLRAMMQGKIGELPRPWEFEKTATEDETHA